MKKHSVILVSIFIVICMLVVAYIVTCGIYFVLDYFEEKNKETQQLEIVQEKNQTKDVVIDLTQYYSEEVPPKVEVIDLSNYKTEENIINIPFNTPPELSYKSKLEIYDIRKNAVRKSIFNTPDYIPSAEVFSMIEGNKPWISMKQCLYTDTSFKLEQ